MSKKKNPKNYPATANAAEQRHWEGVSAGTGEGLMVYMTVLRDKTGYGQKRLKRVWDGARDLLNMISAGAVLVTDLVRELDAITMEPLCPMMHDPLKIFEIPAPPVSQLDVKRSYRKGKEAGYQFATLVFLLSLNKCESFKRFKLRAVHHEAEALRKSIDLGYVKVLDLQQVLEDEVHIKFVE